MRIQHHCINCYTTPEKCGKEYCFYKWPWNLIRDVLKEECEKEEFLLSSDMENGLLYIMDTLSEKKKMVLLERYKTGKTLKNIGEELNVCRERIRRIEKEALRELRQFKNKRWILFGYEGNIRELEKEQKEVEQLKRKIQSGYTSFNDREKYLLSVERQNFDIITQNSLLRSQIYSLDEIKSYHHLKSIRTIGEKKERLVIETAAMYGIVFIDYEKLLQKRQKRKLS